MYMYIKVFTFCAALRKTEGVRFLKFFESNVQVNNTNTTDIVIPRNGFRLSRKVKKHAIFLFL